MNFSKKLFYSISIASSLLIGGVAHADNCYDPYNNTYFACNVDEEEYAYPESEAVIMGAAVGAAVAAGNNNYYHSNGYYQGNNGNNHGNYNNNHGNWNGGGGNGGWHR